MGEKSIRTGTPQKVPAGTENSDTQFHLEILGGSQFESSEHFTHRRTLSTFMGVLVKKNHPVLKTFFWSSEKIL